MSTNIPRRYAGLYDGQLITSIVETRDFGSLMDRIGEWQFKTKQSFSTIVGSILLVNDMKELAVLFCFNEVLDTYSFEDLVEFCNEHSIKLTEQSTDTETVKQRILSKVYRPEVYRKLLTETKEHISQKMSLLSSRYSTFKQKLENATKYFESESGIKQPEVYTTIYMYALALDQGQFARHVIDTFTEDMWDHYENVVFDSFALKGICRLHGRKMAYVGEMNKSEKQLENALDKLMSEQMKTKKIKEELFHSKQAEKSLRQHMYEHNALAEMQTDDHKKDIEELQQMIIDQAEQLHTQRIEIEALKQQLGCLPPEPTQYLSLKGSTICVVGHPRRRQFYKEVIERYGGKFEFVASEGEANLTQLEGPLRRADKVMYLTTFTNHTTSDKMKKIVDSSKVIHLNTGGINSFEQELLTQVIPQLDKVDQIS